MNDESSNLNDDDSLEKYLRTFVPRKPECESPLTPIAVSESGRIATPPPVDSQAFGPQGVRSFRLVATAWVCGAAMGAIAVYMLDRNQPITVADANAVRDTSIVIATEKPIVAENSLSVAIQAEDKAKQIETTGSDGAPSTYTYHFQSPDLLAFASTATRISPWHLRSSNSRVNVPLITQPSKARSGVAGEVVSIKWPSPQDQDRPTVSRKELLMQLLAPQTMDVRL